MKTSPSSSGRRQFDADAIVMCYQADGLDVLVSHCLAASNTACAILMSHVWSWEVSDGVNIWDGWRKFPIAIVGPFSRSLKVFV